MAHAILSPSGASRWLACTPSARLEKQFPDTAGQAAAEGTLAHELAELLVSNYLKPFSGFKAKLAKIKKHELYTHEMLGHAEEYATFVMEQYNESLNADPQAHIELEKKLDLTKWVPEGFGTGDCVIVADGVMSITDLKYGKGVPVSSKGNKQMMLYGLGALEAFGFAYEIHTVRMTIYQPRIDNTSSFEIDVDELMNWAETELKPLAELAFKGEGKFSAGSHCQFCRAKATCKALAEHNLEIAKYQFQSEDLLSEEEISDILERSSQFRNWIKAVEAHALKLAVTEGKRWPGFKLVEGRSVRKYQDTEGLAAKLQEKGFTEDLIFKKELLGITAMTGVLGKPVFKELVEPFLIKPPGKPALVPESDKRPEMDRLSAAQAGFDDQSFDDE